MYLLIALIHNLSHCNQIQSYMFERTGTRKGHYQNEGQPKIYGENAIWNKYVLNFLRKIAEVTVVFKVMGSSFQTLGAATEKARLPKLSFLFGTICCEINDQSCLVIFQR